ncbi:MAG TPA: FtsQ-type POTRA domain-containing protein [Candidatus Limnocylindria bacterium]|jgi:hypothetical protein
MAPIAVLAGLGLGLVALAPVPEVSDVEVTGAHHVAAATVADRSGLRGQPVFRASAVGARRLLLAIPAVRDARVVLSLPDQARITVTERVPAARWILGPAEWFVDADGVLFASSDPAAAPAVRIVDDRPATRGCAGASGGRCVDPALLAAALRLAAIAPGELRADVRAPAVHIDRTETGLVLRTGAGWEVRFGGPEDLDRKLELARRFLRENPTRRLDYLDVRSPERIVFSPQ